MSQFGLRDRTLLHEEGNVLPGVGERSVEDNEWEVKWVGVGDLGGKFLDTKETEDRRTVRETGLTGGV